jgi:hypothetical protein
MKRKRCISSKELMRSGCWKGIITLNIFIGLLMEEKGKIQYLSSQMKVRKSGG